MVRVAAPRHHRIDQVTPVARVADATARRRAIGPKPLADGPRPVARVVTIGVIHVRAANRVVRAVPPSVLGHGGRPMIGRAVVVARADTPVTIIERPAVAANRVVRAVPPSAQDHGERPKIGRAVVALRATTPVAIGVIRVTVVM
ncbi:MAG: hypothetical protein ACYDEH_03260 [Acidimicrobiales bacterium]